jgi:hypothetical protein
LDGGGLLGDLGVLVFDVLEYFHGVVLAVEDASYCLHVAFGDGFGIPEGLEV